MWIMCKLESTSKHADINTHKKTVEGGSPKAEDLDSTDLIYYRRNCMKEAEREIITESHQSLALTCSACSWILILHSFHAKYAASLYQISGNCISDLGLVYLKRLQIHTGAGLAGCWCPFVFLCIGLINISFILLA